MAKQDYKSKEISLKERNILGGLLKQIRGEHTVYKECDYENDSGNFKVVITKLNQ